MPRRIVIAPYDPDWPAFFEREKVALADALGDRAGLISHVGSTAVPGLSAKPTIDIMVYVLSGGEPCFFTVPVQHRLALGRLAENGPQ